jgi:hypothetical protein
MACQHIDTTTQIKQKSDARCLLVHVQLVRALLVRARFHDMGLGFHLSSSLASLFGPGVIACTVSPWRIPPPVNVLVMSLEFTWFD